MSPASGPPIIDKHDVSCHNLVLSSCRAVRRGPRQLERRLKIMPKPILLYAVPEMVNLARRICANSSGRIELGLMSWNRFPDGKPNLFIEEGNRLMGRDVVLLMSMPHPEMESDQLHAHYWLSLCSPKSYRVMLPYFPTATMEQGQDRRKVLTAKTLAMQLSGIPPVGPGPVPIFVWDIHNLTVLDMFNEHHMASQVKTGLKPLAQRLRQLQKEGMKIAIALPDGGADKRFRELLQNEQIMQGPAFPLILCDKIRGKGDERIVTLREGDPTDMDVIVIDDLIHSGATQIRAGQLMHEHKARSVMASATHGVMEEGGAEKLTRSGVFSRIFITDSCPASAESVANNPLFEVISLERSIANAILEGRD